ncbi:phosphotransferase [Mycobacterium sp. E2497]|uniref:phosphotransferase n=1 Tax=Mycobacterium sp. E2497 TaxID=1834135 RepID=UPI000A5AD20D|nr:phosphotransferase [Mycobacterium sp. E2497]
MSAEAAIAEWIRNDLGAEATVITRQARWRPVWLVDADRDGQTLQLLVRGERGDDQPMPFGLQHEMALQKTMSDLGVKVPAVHGWIDSLPAYVMDRHPGRPGFDDLTTEQRDAVMREYMATLAQIHRLPIEPFAAAGVRRAANTADAGAFGMGLFEDLFRAGKTAPNPLLEFMLGWLHRNPVNTRGRESAIVWDSGQLLQLDGKLVVILDFDIGHIGDPMMDLAAPRMRDTVLHFGDFTTLYAEYERAGGYPIDIDAVELHHIAFTLTNELAFRNSLTNPRLDTDYMTNLHWCSETNLHAVEALAERLDIDLEPPVLPEPTPTQVGAAQQQLVDMLRNTSTEDEYLRYRLRIGYRLARYLQRESEVGAELTNADLDELKPLLGYRPTSWREGDAALEEFVLADDGRHDADLCRLFYRRQMRQRATLGPPGSAMAAHHTCQPFRAKLPLGGG